jgi:hypothetical protein
MKPTTSHLSTVIHDNTTDLTHKILPKSSSEQIEAYVFANTPVQLYEALRSLETVWALSKWDTEDLINAYKKLTQEPLHKLERVASAYAVLTALTLKGTDEANVALQRVEPSRLQRGAAIVDYWRRSARPTNLVTASPGPSLSRPTPSSTISHRSSASFPAGSAATAGHSGTEHIKFPPIQEKK